MAEGEVKKVYGALGKALNLFRLEGIQKGSVCNGGGNFNYRSIDSTMAVASKILDACHLIIVPESIERHDEEVNVKGRITFVTRVTVTYRIISTEDGSSITISSIGDGMDFGDKAAGKAMSYAFKEGLFKAFCIPVAGQSDSDSEALDPTQSPNVLEDPAEEQLTHQGYIDALMKSAEGGKDTMRTFWVNLESEDKQEAEWLQSHGWKANAWDIAKLVK